MSLIISRGYNGVSDPDAAAYVAAVEAADGQLLENAVGKAINAFVIGCKNDGTWNAIKASCILAGARTLSGALVPLVGTAPTNFNFASGDYNRKTGLKRNANNKYLDSNRLQSADGQDNHHLSIYKADSINEDSYWIGSGDGSNNFTLLGRTLTYSRSTTSGIGPSFAAAPAGFYGVSRNNSANAQYKRPGTGLAAATSTSQANVTGRNHFVGTFNSGGTADTRGTSSFAFYSIGESLDLALLDARVTALINAFGAAIP